MYEVDLDHLSPIDAFLAQLDKSPPGMKQKARDVFPPDVIAEAQELSKLGHTLANTPEWKSEARNEAATFQAVQQETYFRISELYHLVEFATVRHPDLQEALAPRIGTGADANVENLKGLSERVEAKKDAIAAAGIKLALPAHLTAKAIETQVAAHREAEVELKRISREATATQQQLAAWRGRAGKLQTRINTLVESYVPNDRGLQVKWGYQQRTKPRKKAAGGKSPAAPAPVPANDPAPVA